MTTKIKSLVVLSFLACWLPAVVLIPNRSLAMRVTATRTSDGTGPLKRPCFFLDYEDHR
jgi:hypothetical protein